MGDRERCKGVPCTFTAAVGLSARFIQVRDSGSPPPSNVFINHYLSLHISLFFSFSPIGSSAFFAPIEISDVEFQVFLHSQRVSELHFLAQASFAPCAHPPVLNHTCPFLFIYLFCPSWEFTRPFTCISRHVLMLQSQRIQNEAVAVKTENKI